jgi:anti-sigma factor RsiW
MLLPRRGDESLPGRYEAHLADCASCRAEAAAYRSLQRSLRSLRHVEAAAPPGFVAGVLAAIGRSATVPASRRGAAIGAAITGGAALAAGAIALIVRRQRRAAA